MSHLPKPFNISDALEEESEDDDDSDEEDDELSLITRKIKKCEETRTPPSLTNHPKDPSTRKRKVQ